MGEIGKSEAAVPLLNSAFLLLTLLKVVVAFDFEGRGFLVLGDAAFEEVLLLLDVHHLGEPREGVLHIADERFEAASRLDPESFPLPRRLSTAEFDERLRVAMDRLPEEYQRHLEKVVVTVEDLPADEILLEEDPPLDPEGLLGLFVGISRDQGSSFSPGGELPPRILLSKRNLERLVLDPDELAEQIAITLYHELGHYLGLDEDELADIDFA